MAMPFTWSCAAYGCVRAEVELDNVWTYILWCLFTCGHQARQSKPNVFDMMWCDVMWYDTIYHIIYRISYRISYHIISYRIIPYHIHIILRWACRHQVGQSIPYAHIISYHVMSCHVMSCHIIHIISYHIISYHIISYHIIYNLMLIVYLQTPSWAAYTKRISLHNIYIHIISYHISYHIYPIISNDLKMKTVKIYVE